MPVAPMRTLDPGVTVFSAAEIRVAVLPLGMVPRDVLEEYFQLMQRFRTMSLSAVRSFYQRRSDKTPFQSLDWSGGALHFRFMQVEEARRKSRLLELHPSRQVVAVLGIMHCPVAPSITQAYDEFNRVCKEQFPEARVSRCFVFEPSEDHIVQDNKQHIPGVVVFPPAGGQAHLEQHLEVWMHDLAALVLGELEQWVLDPTPRGVPRPSTSYTDSSEFVGSVTVMEEMAKRLSIPDDEVREKRRRGRLHKAQGDICLMAGSPKDALNNYRVAQELTKATNDWIWYGAVLEALAYIKVTEPPSPTPRTSQVAVAPTPAPATGTATPVSSGQVPLQAAEQGRAHAHSSGAWPSWEVLRSRNVEGEVRELLADARACYKRKGGVLAMQIENALKFARLLVGLHGRSSKREVQELAAWVVEAGASLHFLEDRLVALSEAAQMYGAAGLVRRRALLLWVATDMARGIDKHEMLRLAIKGTEPPEDEGHLTTHQDPLWLDSSARLHWALKQSGLSAQAWSAATGHGTAAVAACAPGPPTLQQPSTTTTTASATAASAAASAGSCSASLAHRGAAWPSVQIAMQDMLLQAARQTGVPSEAWDATASILRRQLHHLPAASHAPMLEGLTLAASAMPPKLRLRPGLGPPCPLARLKRILPLAPPQQPLRIQGLLGCTSSRDVAEGAGEGGVVKVNNDSPFIFNANEKRKAAKEKSKRGGNGKDRDAELVLQGEWVCGEEGRVEVELINPLAVPVKIDSLSLHARLTPAAASAPGAPANAAPAAGTGPSHSTSTSTLHAAEQQQQQQASAWRPVPTQLVLPGHGKPVKVQLRGTALAPGTLTLTGLRVCALGAQWFEPFGLHQHLPSQGLGNGFGVGGAGSMKALQHRLLKPQASSDAAAWHPHEAQTAAPLLRWRQATLTVLPALPALQLVLTRRERRGEDEVLAAAPLPEEPRAEPPPTPSGAGAAATAGSGATPSLATTSSSSTAGAGGSAAPGLKRSSSMTSTSSSLAAAAAAAAASSAPAAAGKLAQAAALASAASRRAVAVWHGQRCSWDLHLTNNGASTITSAHISIANSRGVLLKPLPQGCVRASFAGVHLQPCRKGAASLAAAMPLAPGATAVVPIDVHVGQPLGDAYEEVVLEVRVAYTGPPVADPAGAGAAATQFLGRQLSMPVRFQVQRTVQVAALQFLDVMVPLRDGLRCWPNQGKQDGMTSRSGSSNLNLASPLARLSHPLSGLRPHEGQSESAAWTSEYSSFVRSEPQALWPAQEDAEVDLSPGPTPAAGTHKSSSWDGTDTARMDSRMSADSGSVTRLSLTSECAMDVSVVSVCERYLRVWLERIPPRGGAAGAAGSAPATASSPSTEGPTPSDNVVLPPGEASVLHCGSPLIVPAESSAECVRPLCHEPDRMAAAEVLCDTWAIAWRMIGVGEDEDRAPHGLVQLAAVDVARNLTPQAMSCIQPSQLSFKLTAVYHASSANDAVGVLTPRPRVQELTRRLQQLDARGAGGTGEVWGLRLAIGEVLDLDVELASCSSNAQAVQFSLGVANLACLAELAGNSNAQAHGLEQDYFGSAAGNLACDPGVLLMGQVDQVRCAVDATQPHVHRRSIMFIQAGLYQVFVHDVLAACLPTQRQQVTPLQLGDPHVWASASKACVNMQCLNVICM